MVEAGVAILGALFTILAVWAKWYFDKDRLRGKKIAEIKEAYDSDIAAFDEALAKGDVDALTLHFERIARSLRVQSEAEVGGDTGGQDDNPVEG